jgi:hypothetical protein
MATANLNPGDLYFENIFNDATRILEGGLWSNPVPESNQGTGNIDRYTNDINTVLNGLMADKNAGDFTDDPNNPNGAQLTHVQTVINDLNTILTNAPTAANDASSTAAEAVRTAHLDIINTIQGDPVLEALSVKDDNPGFNFPPPASGHAAADLPGNTFAEIGVIFDDAQNLSLAGVNDQN